MPLKKLALVVFLSLSAMCIAHAVHYYPLLPDTVKMIDTDALGRMKSTALLINCARGELVDEEALYERLKAGGIAGAAIDVFATEPPQSSRLLELENVLATPHIGAYTHEAMTAMDRLCAWTIIDVLVHGRRPDNLLTPDAVR